MKGDIKMAEQSKKKTSKKQPEKKTKVEPKKIEKKEEKVVTKKIVSTSKANKFFNFVDKYRTAIYGFIAGTLITIFVVIIIWPDRIAKLENGTEPVVKIGDDIITADDLYTDMKDVFSVSLLLDLIDNKILPEKYPENDEMNESIKSEAQSYYSAYEQYYGQDKETFLSSNGFSSEAAFIEYLRLKYRRNAYFEDYTKDLVTEKEINNYYEEKVYGDINTKHILVKADSKATDEEKENAESLAKEIISKLDEGKTFDEVKEEYKDSITYEELGYKSYNANLESAYLEEMAKLGNDEYSKTPVKTSYGYHIIYRIDQKEKPALDDIKDEIIESIANQKATDDNKLYYVALDKMRTDAGLNFSDTVLEKKYNDYMSNYK